MHQSTIPSLLQTIWPRWASIQLLTLPIVQTLLPVTFGYSLSTEAVVMRQLKIWKRLWRRLLTRLHKRTSMGHPRSCWNGTSGKLLRRGLEFHVCTINKSAHTKSLETYRMPLVYIYVCIYIYIYIIKSWRQHGVHWFSLYIHPYYPLLLTGFLDCIQYLNRAVVCNFWLVG